MWATKEIKSQTIWSLMWKLDFVREFSDRNMMRNIKSLVNILSWVMRWEENVKRNMRKRFAWDCSSMNEDNFSRGEPIRSNYAANQLPAKGSNEVKILGKSWKIWGIEVNSRKIGDFQASKQGDSLAPRESGIPPQQPASSWIFYISTFNISLISIITCLKE